MRALLLVDIQHDFLPGGALPVTDGNAVIPIANALMLHFELVVATQDWHPPSHASFASQHPGYKPGDVIELAGGPQVLWPDHCVQKTRGAELATDLAQTRIDRVVQKGCDPAVDSYSGFFDNARRSPTGLEQSLRQQGATELCVVGLATDYCVKFTVLDARRLGFQVTVVREGIRGVELQAGDCDRALAEMSAAGAKIISVDALVARTEA